MSEHFHLNSQGIKSQLNTTIVHSVSKLLLEILEENKSNQSIILVQIVHSNTAFDSVCAPTMSIKDYIERIVSLSKTEESTLILTLIFVDRICEKNRIQLNYFTVFKYNTIQLIKTHFHCICYFNKDERG